MSVRMLEAMVVILEIRSFSLDILSETLQSQDVMPRKLRQLKAEADEAVVRLVVKDMATIIPQKTAIFLRKFFIYLHHSIKIYKIPPKKVENRV